MKSVNAPQRIEKMPISKSPFVNKISEREIPESLISLFDKFICELKKTETTTTIDNSARFTAEKKSVITGRDSTLTRRDSIESSFNPSTRSGNIKSGRDSDVIKDSFNRGNNSGGDSTITKDSFNTSIKAGRDVIITNHNEGFKEAYYLEKEKNKLYKKQIENLNQEIEVLKTKLSKGVTGEKSNQH